MQKGDTVLTGVICNGKGNAAKGFAGKRTHTHVLHDIYRVDNTVKWN